MKRSIIITVFLFSLVFNIVFVYYLFTSQNNDIKKDINVLDDISLSVEQQNVIKKKSESILKHNNELNMELKKCRKNLHGLLVEDSPDRGKIRTCIDTISNIQKKMQINTVEQLMIYKKHLSDPQCECFMKNVGVKMGIPHKCDSNCKCNKK